MDAGDPILALAASRPLSEPGEPPQPAIELRVMAGELALVDARHATQVAWFGDLCCGLAPLASGSVRFLGRDWSKLPHTYAAALRGRIGRVFSTRSWIGHLDVATNILLPQLHHTREELGELRQRATSLACAFGLPGLPLVRASELSEGDLARAACVRAFLGDPLLLVLESPVQGRYATLVPPLLDALARARDRGAAAIWLTRSDLVWHNPSVSATHRLRLDDRGVLGTGRAA
ncbi:MAG TPA: ATP-binding cassette domain-containing protein [Stellaceae bacterium]|nr:ATP-binding cassette domain-containing protein [Stellaceae bacterium]